MDKKKRNLVISIIILSLALVLGVVLACTYISFRYEEAYFAFTEGETIVDGHKEIRSIQTIGEYYTKDDIKKYGSLAKYGADTKIYVTCGEEANEYYKTHGNYAGCSSILILGGTHSNEPSGQLTATLMLENLEVSGNTVVFIITETNRSGFSYTFPQEGAVSHYTLTNKNGSVRTFKYGGRATNPVDQWPCPDIYTVERTLPSGEVKTTQLSSTDARNINRAYGVDTPTTYTEKVAYSIKNLILTNDIKISIDLHEASPEYQTINAIVYKNNDANKKLCETIASKTTSFMLSDNAVEIGKAFAPESLRGLTHIELGTFTDSLVFLCETSNASQGKLRGAFTEQLVTYEGEGYEGDLYYERFRDTEILYANSCSISERVARHIMSIMEIIYSYNSLFDSNGVISSELTDRSEILTTSGKLNVSLRLFDDNIGDVDEYFADENYIELNRKYELTGEYVYPDLKLSGSWEALQAYEMIYKYGIGYFLKDSK